MFALGFPVTADRSAVLRVGSLIGRAGVFAALLLTQTQCSAITSNARPQIADISIAQTVGLDSAGSLDAGYRVTFTVTNRGEDGDVLIMPKLSTSEGEWTRTQTLPFKAGETQQLGYTFLEPDVQAENIHATVGHVP